MNEDDKLIKEQFDKLPVVLQKSLKAVEWKSSVKEIAELNKLSPDQAEALERETMFILYGFENIDDYKTNLIREAGFDEVVAMTIAETVNEKVFDTVIAKVKELETTTNETSASVDTLSQIPEIHYPNLPVVEQGETAHDAQPLKPEHNQIEPTKYVEQISPKPSLNPAEKLSGMTSLIRDYERAEQRVKDQVQQKPEIKTEPEKVSLPDYRYPNGKDPYREPLQ
ncbi:MAG: hypothetical protein CO183_00345 [Candidatus Zambryskibacteria bacterium CG_4_9_14_3_um_filter_42_9]|nr:MAG: hypothetical protein CO183_00345 [Candidatus Zambryskibacteria bacterium CG_4_9_14_3_um_filter_42_9]